MRRLVRNVVVGVSALVLLAALWEGGLWFYPPWQFPRQVQQWLTDHPGVAHLVIGALEPPHDIGVFVGGDFRASYRTDGQGFRNLWPWPATVDIVVVGDGATFGYGIDDSQAWPALVAQAVAPNRLLNLALLEAGPLQYARVYEHFGVPLHPKVVVVGLSLADDFQDAELFEYWRREDIGGNYRVWRTYGGMLESLHHPGGMPHTGLAQYSRLYQLFRVPLRIAPQASSQLVRFPSGQYLPLWPHRLDTVMTQAQSDQRGFALALEALAYLQVITRVYGTSLVVVFLPGKEEIYLPRRDGPVPDPGQALREALAQRGITCLDLAPVFRHRVTRNEPLFFTARGSPNATGATLIATHVARHLANAASSYGLLPWQAAASQMPPEAP